MQRNVSLHRLSLFFFGLILKGICLLQTGNTSTGGRSRVLLEKDRATYVYGNATSIGHKQLMSTESCSLA